MSTSPIGGEGIPRDPKPHSLAEGTERFQLAMYKADDCLRRCRDAVEVGDLPNINSAYADRQLMLAAHAVEEARIAVEIIRRAVSFNLAGHSYPGERPAADPFLPSPGDGAPKGGA